MNYAQARKIIERDEVLREIEHERVHLGFQRRPTLEPNAWTRLVDEARDHLNRPRTRRKI